MKKPLIPVLAAAVAVTLAGCSTPVPPPAPEPAPAPAAPAPEPEVMPVPPPAVQSTLLEDMQKLSADMMAAGGLAVVGTGESKSLDLALNKAKKNGRIDLSRALDARFESLEKAFSAETGIPYDSLLLSGFNTAARVIKQQIAGSVAQKLKYETAGETFTAYAVMVLDPKVIADQLAKEKDLYARLQKTKAFETLNQEVKAFAAFKAAQK